MSRSWKPTSIRMAHWNADGLRRQLVEVKEFLARLKPDLFLVSETHLRAGDVVYMPGYDSYRNDRIGARGGGTAIFVRRAIDHFQAGVPGMGNIEATTVVVNTAEGPLRVTAAYKRPQVRLLREGLEGDTPTIVASDLNAKHGRWHSRIANTAGNALARYADEHGLAVEAPQKPTHYSVLRPDVLDIAVLR